MVPLDLHKTPAHDTPSSQHSALPTDLNKSNESPDTKKSQSSSAASTPAKSRRKRKPNVTKKVSASEMSFSETDIDMMNSEGFDIENDLLANVITCAPSKVSHESDDCETIDKIAQMVSNITSTSTNVNLITTSCIAHSIAPKANDELIEHQLAQMFADSNAEPLTSTTGEAAADAPVPMEVDPAKEIKKKKPSKPKQPRKKKVEGEPVKKKQQQQPGNAAKLKNGKLGKKGGKGGDSNENKTETKVKSKESGGKSKAKPDMAPFVQLQKDGSFAIVNQTANGDDDAEKAVNKPKKGLNNDKHKVIRGLHVSTLSNKYDADKRDTTWVCVFCKMGPHKHALGDLFGPYIISKTSEEYLHCLQDPATDAFRQTNKNKFAKVQQLQTTPEKPKKKRKNAATPTTSGTVTNDEVFAGMSKVDDNDYEVWFHEDCIGWASGVYIIGTKIIGMEAAIWSSTRHRCAYCEKNGAMLSCLTRECHKAAHFSCAKRIWKLHDDFKTFCEAH